MHAAFSLFREGELPLSAERISIALLPIIEAQEGSAEAIWLSQMAKVVHQNLTRLIVARVLPEVFQGQPPSTPLVEDTLLVVEPWGMPPVGRRQERLDGNGLMKLLECPAPPQWQAVPFARPALSETVSLSTLGGWDGGSQAGCAQWVSVCPGWDETVTTAGPLCLLRRPESTPDVRAAATRSFQALLSAEASGKGDLQMYCAYLARMLAALLDGVQESLGESKGDQRGQRGADLPRAFFTQSKKEWRCSSLLAADAGETGQHPWKRRKQ